MRKIATLFFGIFSIVQVQACDVCGCGGGNAGAGMGFMPTNDYHYIGFRSNYRRFYSQEHSIITGTTSSTEYFFLNELIGKYQLSKRWQLLGIVPYSFVSQVKQNSTTSQQGIGDVSVLGFYTPILKKDSSGLIRHQLNFGFGVKVPTGKYAQSVDLMSNIYPGTGAFDIQFAANYILQKKKHGFQFEAANTIRLENSYGFQYGNVTTVGANYFIALRRNDNLFRPFIGVQGNYFAKDVIDRVIVNESVNFGPIVTVRIGLNFSRLNWFASLSGQVPIYQNLGDGAVQQKEAVQFSLNYLIPKKSKK